MTKTKTTTGKLIAEFNKNASETVRVQLTEYDGKQLLDIRVWVQNDKGEYIPTRKGISLRVEQVRDLKDALEKVEHELEKSKFS